MFVCHCSRSEHAIPSLREPNKGVLTFASNGSTYDVLECLTCGCLHISSQADIPRKSHPKTWQGYSSFTCIASAYTVERLLSKNPCVRRREGM